MDSKTISCNFIGYPERSKGFRFYCHGQGPKIFETRHVVFLENEYFSGRTELKKLTSNEVSTPMMEYGVTQEVSHNENENVPTTEVSLRRAQREKRLDISNDYEVYLNECDYDVGL